jgi:hypothetical protein
MRFFLNLFILLVFSSEIYSQVLPANRSVNWSLAGYHGTVPNYTTVINIASYGGLGDGLTPTDTAFADALNALSGGDGVIYFPAGNYLFKSPISLRSNLILRGATSDSTTLKFELASNNSYDAINISGSATGTVVTLANTAYKDSTFIEVDSASNFATGDYIKLTLNDSALAFSTWAYGTVGQIVKINAIVNNRIYLESALRMDYALSKNPKITKLNMITNVGIECLKIHRADATASQTSSVVFNYATQCWVSGIESYMCNFGHIELNYSTNVSILGAYFNDAHAHGGGGQGYGVIAQATSGECLIENNIFKHLRHSMLLQSGANGNVFGYNYSIEPYWSQSGLPANSAGDMVLHGNYPYANLFEGNIGQNIVIDDSHGENGPYNTFFRNRGELYGIFMNNAPASNNQNFIGNEITNTGVFLGFYSLNGTGHFQHGNNVKGTIYASGTSTLTDTSYYYTALPSFLQTLSTWPSVGIPNTISTGTIPAKERYLGQQYSTCSSVVLSTNIASSRVDDNTLSFYPNPTTGLVYIKQLKNIEKSPHLEVYDCLGNIVVSKTLNQENDYLDFSKYAKGIYTIKAGTTNYRIVLQ